MEHIVSYLSTIDIGYVYIAMFLIAYIENIFPPFPSDAIIVFGGSLVAMQDGNAMFTTFFSTLGSMLGFMSMYWIGRKVGENILDQGKIKFIPVAVVMKAETWFRRYGYWVIVVNRFLAGTRAAVSFCAGASEMNFWKTTVLSTVSALAWNGILVYAGIALGRNWRAIGSFISNYSLVVSSLIVAAILCVLIIAVVRNRRTGKRNR